MQSPKKRKSRIKYSPAERDWIQSNCTLPRSKLHAAFVEKFARPDVSRDNIESLCTREGWSTGRRKKGIKPIGWTDQQIAFVKDNHKQPRADLFAAFTAQFPGTDITLKNLQSLCTQKGWLYRNKTRGKIEWNNKELSLSLIHI